MPVILTNTGITFNDGTSTNTNLVPAGTKMLFGQTAAPTGWTKQTTHDNKALRIVSGTKADGGLSQFTSAFSSRTISATVGGTTIGINEMPAHRHSLGNNALPGYQAFGIDDSNFSFPGAADSGAQYAPTSAGEAWLGSKGGSSSHTHGFTGTSIDMAVAYVDVIVAMKD